jgi:foldase protein PrsA
MTKTPLRFAMALGAFFVVAMTLVACGGGDNSVPGNAIAVVDGQPITKASFNRWLEITAKGASAGNPRAVVPDPPSYTNCIAQLRKQSKPAKGQPKPTDTTLRAQCKAQEEQIKQQTVATLIQSAWVEGEAKKQGVSVTDAAVQQQLQQTKKQSFPTAKAYDKFLKQSGMTQAEVLDRVRVQLLAQRITQKVQQDASPVTDAQVKSYYNRNRAQFSIPERRDLEIILTKSKAQANQAKAAIQGGMSWKDAAKKYSTDAASKANGGLLRGVAKGQQDKALDEAAFSAKKGAITGPVKGQFGWYIVRVDKVTPPKETSLEQAKAQIKPLLAQQGSQQKMASFITDFQKRWKDKTNCRAGYVVQLCKNAPKAQTTGSTAGGTVATPTQSTTTTTK